MKDLFPDYNLGLKSSQISQRLETYGNNELERAKEFNLFGLLFDQFRSPLIYVLVFAAFVTLVLHEYADTAIIMIVVFFNAFLGFYQEFKAAKSLEALRNYLKPQVVVRRDGKRQEILMKKLVPRDVVFLDPSSSVPADGILVESDKLLVNEALLTGESRPIDKQATDQYPQLRTKATPVRIPNPQETEAVKHVYMGTTVAAGIGLMVVVRTGNQTEMGKIAKSLTETKDDKTPLQEKLAHLAQTLMYVVVVITLIMFGIGLLSGRELLEMFETSVAVAVAAIPEGLVISMTVILSIGMQRILRRKALVRRLVAAETLGSVDVIYCDKTGTLTEGKMSVVAYLGDNLKLVQLAALANDERDEEGLAMTDWVNQQLKTKSRQLRATNAKELTSQYQRLDSVPFSSEYKYMAVLAKHRSQTRVFVAGAPEIVLQKTTLTESEQQEVLADLTELASQGYRLIGYGIKPTKSDQTSLEDGDVDTLEWVGVLAFMDPIRKGVKTSLRRALSAGVDVKVITGDNKDTAIAVLSQVLPRHTLAQRQVITGPELAQMDSSRLKDAIEDIVLFARTSPDQKLRIVNALKDRGHVVAMTGDGVNDAPALKAADIGVVVNEATDVSKQTADMVLLDSNFKTIIAAIGEGRSIYETLRRTVTFLLGGVSQELFLIGGAIMMGLPLPITAVQILWINLVVDGLPGIALAFSKNEAALLKTKPRKRDQPLLDLEMKTLIIIIGVVANLILVGLYWFLYNQNVDQTWLRSFMYSALATNSTFYIMSVKSLRYNIWQQPLFDNRYLLAAMFFSTLIVFATLYFPGLAAVIGTVPLSIRDWFGLLIIAGSTMMLIEGVKYIFKKSEQKVEKK